MKALFAHTFVTTQFLNGPEPLIGVSQKLAQGCGVVDLSLLAYFFRIHD
jgi:hypothetical protein